MSSEGEGSSPARAWWLLIGAFVVFVVLFSVLEKFVRPNSAGSESSSSGGSGAPAPDPPEVRRLEGGGIEIRHDFFRRSTIRMGSEEDEEEMFECLSTGFEEAFGDGTEGWGRRRVRQESKRVQDECLDLPQIPVPPRPPGP